jgi:hypothetical protein
MSVFSKITHYFKVHIYVDILFNIEARQQSQTLFKIYIYMVSHRTLHGLQIDLDAFIYEDT